MKMKNKVITFFKQNYLALLLLVIISLAGFISHLVQVSFGWGGLYWTTHYFFSFLIAPMLFFVWLNFLFKWRISIVKNLFLTASYTVCFCLVLFAYQQFHSRWIAFAPRYFVLFVIFAPFVVPFLMNLIITFLLKLKVKKWEFPLLFFLPVMAHLIAQPMLRLVFWKNCDDPIFQFKTGTIIFGYMLCEGLFVLLHKKNENEQMTENKKLFLAFSAVLSIAAPIFILATKMPLLVSVPLFFSGILCAVVALKIALPMIKQDKKNGRESPTVLFFAIMAGASFGADLVAAFFLILMLRLVAMPF